MKNLTLLLLLTFFTFSNLFSQVNEEKKLNHFGIKTSLGTGYFIDLSNENIINNTFEATQQLGIQTEIGMVYQRELKPFNKLILQAELLYSYRNYQSKQSFDYSGGSSISHNQIYHNIEDDLLLHQLNIPISLGVSIQ